MPSPRLAYLVSQFPTMGHAYILREITELRKLGIEIEVASIRPPDRALEKLNETEYREASEACYLKSLGALSVLKAHLTAVLKRPAAYARGLLAALSLAGWNAPKLLRHLAYFAEAVIVGQWMESRRLVHVHAHFSSNVALLLARIFPVTLSMTVHGAVEFDDLIGFNWKEKVHACSFVCAISNFARSQLMSVCDPDDWHKIVVAPLGVDPACFDPAPFRADPSPWRLVCVARLAPVKAHLVLIAALKTLVLEGRRVRLHLVGDGPLRPMMERRIAALGLTEHVCFEGWLDQTGIRRVCAESDIFVLPSFNEGVPVALMEAMAMELPCVSTYIAGTPELIRDGLDGLLVPASDEASLAEALRRLMDDPGLRQQFRTSGRKRVSECYDLHKNVSVLAGLFQNRAHERP